MKPLKRTPNTVCLICAKSIYRRPFQIKNGPVYCSRKCAQQLKKKPEIKCFICNNTFARNLRKKYCSVECVNKNRVKRGKYRTWNGKSLSNKSQRLKIDLLELRPHKCNRCDYAKIPILNVHHTIERSNGGTDELDNLELLCPNCHAEHHYSLENSLSN